MKRGKNMTNILEEAEVRMKELKQIICDKEIAVARAPEGVLNIAKERPDKKASFYYKESSSDTKKQYIKSADIQRIQALCQKDYDQRVLKAAKEELKKLEKLYNSYPNTLVEDVYAKLLPERQQYVEPIYMTDTQFREIWLADDYERKPFKSDFPEYYTDRGERVRSKSEILIANLLNKYDIPYKYERPMYLAGYGKLHPDFTILNMRQRKEMILEHLGKMDDPEYAEKACLRIDAYERNGYFPGETLLLTYETLRYPLDMRVVEKLIQKHLL